MADARDGAGLTQPGLTQPGRTQPGRTGQGRTEPGRDAAGRDATGPGGAGRAGAGHGVGGGRAAAGPGGAELGALVTGGDRTTPAADSGTDGRGPDAGPSGPADVGDDAGTGQIVTVSRAVRELSELLVDEGDVQDTLQRVAALAKSTIAGCAAAGVTLVADRSRRGPGARPGAAGRPTGYVTAAATDADVQALDDGQYSTGSGPCLAAIAERRVIRTDVGQLVRDYPRFTAQALRIGYGSVLAAPLLSRGEAIGALNLYSHDNDGFAAVDEAIIAMFCGQASVAVANAQLYRSARALSEQMTTAMESRAVIEQAKGALAVVAGQTTDEAFTALVALSQRRNVKLRDLAAQIVAAATDPLALRTLLP